MACPASTQWSGKSLHFVVWLLLVPAHLPCSYDPGSNCWKSVAPMGTRRLGVGVAVTGGCLYAVGGSDGSVPLASVERYSRNNIIFTPILTVQDFSSDSSHLHIKKMVQTFFLALDLTL